MSRRGLHLTLIAIREWLIDSVIFICIIGGIIGACSSLVGCGAQVEPPDVEEEPLKPLGTWIETRPPSLEERLVFVSEDTICGPTGRCEAVVEWGRDTVTTDEGLYQW